MINVKFAAKILVKPFSVAGLRNINIAFSGRWRQRQKLLKNVLSLTFEAILALHFRAVEIAVQFLFRHVVRKLQRHVN